MLPVKPNDDWSDQRGQYHNIAARHYLISCTKVFKGDAGTDASYTQDVCVQGSVKKQAKLFHPEGYRD